MTVTTSYEAPTAAGAVSHERLGGPPPAGEACPLCGTPLHATQEWCLQCGAAARTRLAGAPNWRLPIVALAIAATVSLGVLAAALVKLAGDPGSTPARVVGTVITRPAAPAAPTPTTGPPAASTSGSSLHGTGTTPALKARSRFPARSGAGEVGASGAAQPLGTLTPAARRAFRELAERHRAQLK